MTRARIFLAAGSLFFAGAALLASRSVAGGGGDDGDAAVLSSLSSAKHSLADGVAQAAMPPSVALSAKFEDEGKGLSLSVYVAAKGLGDADSNVLEERAGSPTAAAWTPETEEFKDVEHVARSAEQLTLMRLTPLSLADVIAKAQKLQKGTVISVTPAVRGGKGVFLVRVAADGKVIALTLDLATGAPLSH